MIISVRSDNPETMAVLRDVAARHPKVITLWHDGHLPTKVVVGEPIITIIDLTVRGLSEGPPTFHLGENVEYILLARPEALFPFEWLEFARHPRVTMIRLRRDDPHGQSHFASKIERRLDDIPSDDIIAGVLALYPGFRSIRGIVAAVIERPWQVRRATDLLQAPGEDFLELDEYLRTTGVGERIKRPEHVLTAIRALGLEYLVFERRITLRRARLLVGIDDSSNFRKQAKRAAYLLGRIA